jgi:hypothetical protein
MLFYTFKFRSDVWISSPPTSTSPSPALFSQTGGCDLSPSLPSWTDPAAILAANRLPRLLSLRLRALRLTLQEMAAREERVCRQGCAAVSGEKWDMAARQERAVDDTLLPNTAEGLQFLVRRSMHHLPLWCPTSCLTTLSGSFCWALFLALQSSDMRHLHDHATAAV